MGGRLGKSLREAACYRKVQGRWKFSFIREGRGAGLFETIVREAGRRQANDIKVDGRLDLCDKSSLNNL